MEIEDISRAQPAALPDCIVIPGAVGLCREPSETRPSDGTRVKSTCRCQLHSRSGPGFSRASDKVGSKFAIHQPLGPRDDVLAAWRGLTGVTQHGNRIC